MVICKFYQQGNCRYGQYCQFDHVNRFATNAAKVDSEDDIPIVVAKEVLFAERGGQWLLSCFAPFKDRPSIPGMEDLSPEEVRWEIYQGQKSGTVEQAKLRFQQLCQDMKAKREMLRNPNREVIAILKKLLGSVQKGGLSESNDTAGKSSSFSFAAPQLGLANNASSNNVFGKQMFGVQTNSFGGGFVTSNKTLMFGRAAASMTPMFGGTPTFGNNLNFGSATNTSSFFGGTTSTSSFNGVQNPPAFGSVAAQTNSVFGGTAQGMFGQNGIFGGTGQLGSQSTTAFDSGTTASTSLFNSTVTSQANPSLFGTTQTTTANLFGGSPSTQTSSVFSATTSSGPFTGIFNQSKSLPAFGGAPVFGGVTNYTGKSGTIFGASALTFGTPAISTNNIFGASAATTTPVFGTLAATTAFGGTATIPAPVFGLCQQPAVNTFGATVSAPSVFGTQNTDTAMSMSGNMPFGGSTIGTPFVTASSQFGSTSTASASFAGTGFGLTTANTGDTFRPTMSSTPLFANAGTNFVSSNTTVSNPSPFAAPAFSNLTALPFGAVSTTIASSTSTTTTTISTTVNPFAPRTQQTDTPFGSVAQNQPVTNASSPFGKSPFNTQIIDDTVYTEENLLTDDEKSMYFVDKFVFGKIPLKPPAKDIR